MLDELLHRLNNAAPTILRICDISGIAGASIGVLHHNQVIHTANFGLRNIEKNLPPDENTLYHIASLSKSFTATALAILVAEDSIQWEQPIANVMPDFRHEDEDVYKNATILDMASHRLGLATKNSLWVQDHDVLLLKPADLFPTVSYLEVIHPLRSTWVYNNFGYNMAAAILEHLEGKSWGSVLLERITAPLGLSRTFTDVEPSVDNQAEGYMALSNGPLLHVSSPTIGNGTIMQGANGVKSCVKDLLAYYGAVIQASKGKSNLLGDIPTLVTGHIPMSSDSQYNERYGAGWALTDLPSPVGAIGTNGMFLSEMPVVGKGSPKRKLWYHNGSLVGFFSSVHILPDTETAIVVLVNSMPRNDGADWIGQFLLELILDNPDKNDYVSLANESAAAYGQSWEKLKNDMDNAKSNETSQRQLTEYVGCYYNRLHNWYIEVKVTDASLQFAFQGLSSQKHVLAPFGKDRFSWLLSELQSAELVRWPDLDCEIYTFEFEADENGNINGLRWVHDADVPHGELFQQQLPSDKSFHRAQGTKSEL